MEQKFNVVVKPNFLSRLSYISLVHNGPCNNSWLCFDKQIEKIVFVKSTKTNITNLRNEAEIYQKLNSPYYAKYYDFLYSEDTETAVLILEYLEGDNLRNLKGSFDLREIIKHVIEGLKHLHNIGYVHNDIKPANIFLTKSRDVKILDLEAAQPTGSPYFPTTKKFRKPGITHVSYEDDFHSLIKTVKYCIL